MKQVRTCVPCEYDCFVSRLHFWQRKKNLRLVMALSLWANIRWRFMVQLFPRLAHEDWQHWPRGSSELDWILTYVSYSSSHKNIYGFYPRLITSYLLWIKLEKSQISGSFSHKGFAFNLTTSLQWCSHLLAKSCFASVILLSKSFISLTSCS